MEDWDKSYWSPGKLLITSEYVVIDGADALALPTKKGQSLKVRKTGNNTLNWVSKNNLSEAWFTASYCISSLEIIESSDVAIATRLSDILNTATELSKQSLLEFGWDIETSLDFPQNWGLGSSSTLLCNVAKWFDIDPFQLHFAVSNGSGYDIASGMGNTPLLYNINDKQPIVKHISFNPSYKDQIYFIHLNQKQISDKEVEGYNTLKKELNLPEITTKFSDLTASIMEASELGTFETTLTEHEYLLANILQRETIKDELFQMYEGGVVKSLGAWGGDFVLVTAKEITALDYFKTKGYKTIIPYSEMINQV